MVSWSQYGHVSIFFSHYIDLVCSTSLITSCHTSSALVGSYLCRAESHTQKKNELFEQYNWTCCKNHTCFYYLWVLLSLITCHGYCSTASHCDSVWRALQWVTNILSRWLQEVQYSFPRLPHSVLFLVVSLSSALLLIVSSCTIIEAFDSKLTRPCCF